MSDETNPELTDPTAPPDVVADFQAQIDGVHARIDESNQRVEAMFAQLLEKQAAEDAPPVDPPPDPTAMMLPEGTTRFFCPAASDFQIILKHKTFITTREGHHETIPQRMMNFTSHICTTDDEELIDLARAYITKKGTKSEFFEDPTAQPMDKTQIRNGARGTGSVPSPADTAAVLAARN